MFLFAQTKDVLQQVKETPFLLEREIQNLVEKNLNELLGLDFVKSEFSISGSVQQLRIDTLAFDSKNKSFVIIEYKQDQKFSVVDQGYAYLSAMLNNKADFILEYNEKAAHPLKKSDVDWSQSRVFFISQAFTSYQKEAINFQDLPIALWEIRRYSNKTISFESIHKINATESIKTISSTKGAVEAVSKEVVVYTENDLLANVPEEMQDLYRLFKDRILELGDIEIKFTKLYIAFTVNGSNFTEIEMQKKSFKMWLNLLWGELDDPLKIMRNVSKIGHHGNGDYEITVTDAKQIDYLLSLVKKVYDKKMNSVF